MFVQFTEIYLLFKLMTFDQKHPVLCVDSSPVGTGAVMAHVFEDGSERPVAYVSRKFSDTETRYSQFDREM